MKYLVKVFGFSLIFIFSFSLTAQDNNKFAWPAEGSSVIGNIQSTTVEEGETLLDIAERYGLGYNEIVAANRDLDPWIPEVGAKVTLPTQFILPTAPMEGIVVNLAEYRLYYFMPEKNLIYTYPIGIGQGNTPTPIGRMEINARMANPTWYPPASIRQRWQDQGKEVRRQIPAGPDNPLGPYAINLSKAGYLIHGTNQRFGIGTRASAGCIRMNNQDIQALVEMTYIGVPVNIIEQPIKTGWSGKNILIEAHRPVSVTDNAVAHKDMVTMLVELRARHKLPPIDWTLVDKAFNRKDGIPFAVNQNLAHYDD
ncbi:hypothetical protein CWE09_10190 [Aliidiomarina minuta]|uniref:Uncharacterized protein n=1 Tax=Aliidiomarina minuta TaxID=880057 RepID=A0A432WBR6_9GAMM|nr:L,D-transpeptidase family protein [Aliidiomarina minuta]RUO27038.1 hypothetical protein CWE09_10190 [Aliidiomarina minuta]